MHFMLFGEFNMIIICLLLIWLLIEILFFLTHRKPLNEKEIFKLAKKRREKYIRQNYSFKLVNSYPDKDFKSSIRP